MSWGALESFVSKSVTKSKRNTEENELGAPGLFISKSFVKSLRNAIENELGSPRVICE